jgi:hypothetical protein
MGFPAPGIETLAPVLRKHGAKYFLANEALVQ